MKMHQAEKNFCFLQVSLYDSIVLNLLAGVEYPLFPRVVLLAVRPSLIQMSSFSGTLREPHLNTSVK